MEEGGVPEGVLAAVLPNGDPQNFPKILGRHSKLDVNNCKTSPNLEWVPQISYNAFDHCVKLVIFLGNLE